MATGRLLFWLVARSLTRWHAFGGHGEQRFGSFVALLRRHNALATFLHECPSGLRDLPIFPDWERGVARVLVAHAARGLRWPVQDAAGEPIGYSVHGPRVAFATVSLCVYGVHPAIVAAMARWAGPAGGGYVRRSHPGCVVAIAQTIGLDIAGECRVHRMDAEEAQGAWERPRHARDILGEKVRDARDTPAAVPFFPGLAAAPRGGGRSEGAAVGPLRLRGSAGVKAGSFGHGHRTLVSCAGKEG